MKKNSKKLFFFMSNLQTYYHFKLDFHKVDQHLGGKWLIHGTNARTISCKAWNFPVEYHSRKCKHDIKESKGNMFNPIFKVNVQGWKHSGSCTFAETELLSYRKPKRVVQIWIKMNKKTKPWLYWYSKTTFLVCNNYTRVIPMVT